MKAYPIWIRFMSFIFLFSFWYSLDLLLSWHRGSSPPLCFYSPTSFIKGSWLFLLDIISSLLMLILTNSATFEYVVGKSLALSILNPSWCKVWCRDVMTIEFGKSITCTFFELNLSKKSFKNLSFTYYRDSICAKVFGLLPLVEKGYINCFLNFEKELIMQGDECSKALNIYDFMYV